MKHTKGTRKKMISFFNLLINSFKKYLERNKEINQLRYQQNTQLNHHRDIFRTTYKKYNNPYVVNPWADELYLKALDCIDNHKGEDGEYYLEKAAAEGSADALFHLGCDYSQIGDDNTAKEYFDKAAIRGHKEALCNLGYQYDQEGNYPNAEALYLLAFQRGDIEAGINLGTLYVRNNDLKKAEEILKPIAKRGFSKALLYLGETYRKAKRNEEAKHYLHLAAKYDLSDALYCLGLTYADENKEKAIEYYRAAADRNNERAQTMLGILHYESGDIDTAKSFYELAIQKNEPGALYNLAYIKAEEQDYGEAKRLYKLAADQNFRGEKERLNWIESIESFRMNTVTFPSSEERFFDEIEISEQNEVIKNEINQSQKNTIFSKPAIPLCSSYEDREAVKKLGAKWCPKEKTWFIPIQYDREPFGKFLPLIYQPTAKPFFPILVPQNLWYKNLRAFLPKSSWHELRYACYKSSNQRCVVCGQRGNLHCDEVWNYEITNQKNGIVHFEKLSPLCSKCHRVKHFGKAEADNLGLEAFARLLFINELTAEEGLNVIENVYEQWESLSQINWKFNFDNLEKDYDIYLKVTDIFFGVESRK